MKDFIKFMKEYGFTAIFVVLVVVGFATLITLMIKQLADDSDKNKCYEIYATDNVILKKCEKYFEGDK